MKAADIHPILGYEAHLTFGSRHDREARLEVGERPVPTDLDPAELASWTSVARVLLNLHETIERN